MIEEPYRKFFRYGSSPQDGMIFLIRHLLKGLGMELLKTLLIFISFKPFLQVGYFLISKSEEVMETTFFLPAVFSVIRIIIFQLVTYI